MYHNNGLPEYQATVNYVTQNYDMEVANFIFVEFFFRIRSETIERQLEIELADMEPELINMETNLNNY